MMRVPLATYRLQFNSDFDFRKAREIIDYLYLLGISDIYASPIFKARRESSHGYDVVDPNALNPEIGGRGEFRRLRAAMKSRGLGWIQDVVANHMAYDPENEMLLDVLEWGRTSRSAAIFDIDWEHPYEGLKGKLLAPFLGRFYGEELEEGRIPLSYKKGELSVSYGRFRFPLRVESYEDVFARDLDRFQERMGRRHRDFIRYRKVIHSLRSLQAEAQEQDRRDRVRMIKKALWELYLRSADIRKFVDGNLGAFNGKKGDPASFNLLDDLLSRQHFRLSFWKVANEEIDYRRFFNVNEFISVRLEDEDVFSRTHSFLFELIRQGEITGLRVDHIDGLYDPAAYLKRIRKKAGDIYLVVEKILAPEEEIPSAWPVQGTTGYDWLNHANGVLCENLSRRKFDRIYRAFTGSRARPEVLLAEKKRLIIGKNMAGDVTNLAHLLKRTSARTRSGRDLTLHGLQRALVEVLAHFPVYRTYVSRESLQPEDSRWIRSALAGARREIPGLVYEFDFLEKLLLGQAGRRERKGRGGRTGFAMRFQQLSGPVMAKGFEDTFYYVYNRLISLNEVGGSPASFGVSLERFHGFNARRTELWPCSLNATSTHDTKRGEDARARLNVLSEIPEEWQEAVQSWARFNRRKKKKINGVRVPTKNDEYFFYQSLLGSFPFLEGDEPAYLERLTNFLRKAVREAKVHTAWIRPDEAYEEAYLAFARQVLEPGEDNLFLKEFLEFQKKVAFYGVFNSLSQSLLKITSPGVPDFYQGTELWDLRFVDPDNRRPVDYRKRERYLRRIASGAGDPLVLIKELLDSRADGRIKLFLIFEALRARRGSKDVFQRGAYAPLETGGKFGRHAVAFLRTNGGSWALTLVPRFLTAIVKNGMDPFGAKVWGDTHLVLPPGVPARWRDAFTGLVVVARPGLFVGEALSHFPVALLLATKEES
jgi:(1->4)-alpha-D-glucan 1-alpha-D-glucosylmutase